MVPFAFLLCIEKCSRTALAVLSRPPLLAGLKFPVYCMYVHTSGHGVRCVPLARSMSTIALRDPRLCIASKRWDGFDVVLVGWMACVCARQALTSAERDNR